jgi:uncharacterized protein (TIGR02597 family)
MPSSIRSTRALLAALAALGGFLSFSNAQSVATTPVGAMTYSLPATSQSVATHFSVPLVSAPVFSGPVASLTSNTLTFSGTPFTAGSLSVAGSPFFLRISSGAQAGRMILVTANTTNSVTLDTTDNSGQTTALDLSGFAVSAGDKVELVPGDTLGTMFGTGGSLILTGNASPLFADTVSIWNKNTGKNDIFFYDGTKWRTTTVNSNRDNQVLYPETGLIISRPSGRSALSFTVLGTVPVVKPLIKTTGSASTIHTGTSYPVDMTLSQLAFAGWVKNNNVLFADQISVWNASTGKFDIYYQRADNSQWNRSGGGTTDRSAVVVPAGTGFRITKTGTVSGSSSFLSVNIPYTL